MGRDGATDQFVSQLVAALEGALDVLDSTRQRTFSEISLADIQSGGNTLRVDTVYESGGVLKIVRTGDVFAGTLAATGSVGTVTVSTP